MKAKDFSWGASVLAVVAVIGGLDMVLEVISLVVRYEHAGASVDFGWRFDAWVTLPILLVALVYAVGMRQGVRSGGGAQVWQHFVFYAGLATLYFVLESPFDAISDRLFLAHQIQHMALTMVVPILVVISMPQGTLLRGLPATVRRSISGPFFRSRVFRSLRSFAHPATATVLYIGVNYFWMIPHIHDLALQHERIHDLFHLTILLVGLIFFWRILDPRPVPLGPSLLVRLLMFWLAAMADILLGSFLAFKSVVLYHAYGPSPHLFGIDALDDERYGGLTMWIPGAGMLAVAILLTIGRFGLEEERREARQPAPRETVPEFLARRRAANRRLARGLLMFAGIVFLVTFTTIIIYRYVPAGLSLTRR